MRVQTAKAVVDKAYRDRLAAWLAFHDIDPNEVPVHATIKVNPLTRRISVEVFARDETGKLRHDGQNPLTTTVTVPLRTMPPKDSRR